jgi:hypothetical protein
MSDDMGSFVSAVSSLDSVDEVFVEDGDVYVVWEEDAQLEELEDVLDDFEDLESVETFDGGELGDRLG